MVLGRESGHDVIPSQHFCVRMCIVYLCFQYTLRRFLVQVAVGTSTRTGTTDCAVLYMYMCSCTSTCNVPHVLYMSDPCTCVGWVVAAWCALE